MGFYLRSIQLFTQLEDTPDSYVGQAGEFVRVNSGETGLEFVPASSIVLTQYLLKGGDTATGQIIFDSGIKLNDNDNIVLGTGNDALIFYDGTDLHINPKSVGSGIIDTDNSDLRVGHIGLDDSAPTTNNIVFGNTTSSSARAILNFTLNYTGTSSATVIVGTGTWQTSGTASNISGASIRAELAVAQTTTTGTTNGVVARTGINASVSLTGGAHELNALSVGWLGSGSAHSGGTLHRRMLYQSLQSAIAGVGTDNLWGALFNNDVQLNSGAKLILEGTDTTKGDSYFDFGSSTIRGFLNGTQELSIASGFIDALNGLKIGTGTEITKYLSASATLDFPNTLAGLSSDLTITLTGASVGDIVVLGVPNGSVNANTCYTAWVSATNTITVRFNNYSVLASDPASGTFKVGVIQS